MGIRFTGLLLLALALTGCHRNQRVETDESGQAVALSVIRMSDLHAANQLGEGFYGLEAGAWRWTAAKFNAILGVPAGAREKGATLRFQFTLPQGQLAKLHGLTISGKVGATALDPETYTTDGDHEYARPVPASALAAVGPVHVDFTLDHTVAPSGSDLRQLGVVAKSISLDKLP